MILPLKTNSQQKTRAGSIGSSGSFQMYEKGDAMRTVRIVMRGLACIIIAMLLIPPGIPAQDSGEPEQSYRFKNEELTQMLASVALYPDSLIAQILMASTYPLEVVEAERWLRQNKELKGDTLSNALQEKPWDPSVKSLCYFPDVLFAMSEKLDQTRKLGDAFLSQEDEVMSTIQDLRRKAQQQGNLKTTDKQEVIIEKEVITIAPVDPDVIYVPVYDPLYVYGPWWYPAYPPYYWYYPPGFVVSTGYIGFGSPVFFGFGFSWAWFDWDVHHVHVDHHKTRRFHKHHGYRAPEQDFWRHSPNHRRGVAYRDRGTSRRFGTRPSQMRPTSPETRGYPQRRSVYGTPEPSRSPVERREGINVPRPRTDQERIQRTPRMDNPFRGIDNGSFERKASERGVESRRSIDIRRSDTGTRRQGGEIRRQSDGIRQPGGGSRGSGRGGGFRR